MERVRHQLACANCMLANTNHPVNKDYHFFVKIFPILFQPQLFLKVPLLILLLVKVPFFNMMSLEMVLAVSRKEAIIWLPAVINIYL